MVLYTKEKPFVCHCGAAFTRRDLLTRHERIAAHETPTGADGGQSRTSQDVATEPDVAVADAAASLSSMSATWAQQSQYINNQPPIGHPDEPNHAFNQPILDQAIFEQEQEQIVGFDRFGEFASFLDGVGLPIEWSPYFVDPDLGDATIDPPSRQSRAGSATPNAREPRPSTPFSSWLPSAPERSGLPQNAPDAEPRRASDVPSFRVSEEQRLQLTQQLGLFENVVPSDFKLPSRHSLTRYITSYFEGFHLHMPFIIILMGYATWEPKESQVREALILQGLLVQALRVIGLEEDAQSLQDPNEMSLHSTWSLWLSQESARRAKLIAFTFLHTHSVAYNIYPVLRSNELRLRLPCSTKEWKAASAVQWIAARREIAKEQLDFQQAMALLLRNSDGTAPLDPLPTPLGNYVLLHGLLQRIHIVRDLSLPIMDQTASLPSEEVCKLERALRSWTTGWQQAPESTLDPKNENGPIPFTSSSLLGLAYVRIYLNLGPYRLLETRDPARVASALSKSPPVKRSEGVISALLYAAHALSIPVRLGIDRVARSQAFFWSVRHSLSALECAILLSKWLHEVSFSSAASAPLSDSEDRILHWVRCIVEEAYAAVDFHGEPSEFQGDPLSLSIAVLRIWAHFSSIIVFVTPISFAMAYEYALVHLTYTIPLAGVLTVVLKPLLTRLDLYKTLVLILIAFFATLPWDSYLIRHGVWTYPPSVILGPRLFGIPIEELFFFIIQTYITTLLYILLNKPILHAQFLTNRRESSLQVRRLKGLGQILLSVAIIIGASLVRDGAEGTYLGLILIWAGPITLLTWTFSGYFLLQLPFVCIALPICLPTIYLWFVDERALGRGTWAIESGTKLGWRLWGSLELEEAVFFLATNTLIVFGLVAFDRGMAVLDTFPGTRPGVSRHISIGSVVKAIFTDPAGYDMKRVRGIREAVNILRKKSRSFYLASSVFPGCLRIDLVLLYSFCRVADDLVDESSSGPEALAWIQKLTEYLDLAYDAGGKQLHSATDIESYVEKNFPISVRSALELLPTKLLPSGPLYELLEGFKMDLAFTRAEFPIKTEADIRAYAHRVASTVGQLCLWLVFRHSSVKLTKEEESKLVQAAITMGHALQYVNIARDIQVDAEMSRVYLPSDWLSEEGLTPQDILANPRQPKAEVLRQKLLVLAFEEYEKSRPTMNLLPNEIRGPLVVAVESYMEIGRVLREKSGVPSKTKRGRATVPRTRRLWVAWKNLSAS
ncbi:hypothetical protein O1611_g833 [Lasiodiplodia mahajangana]|uniref:Uncharacterized protein n=1 Tax=Lasiodiplodia mahajangana TaxID=1108764 RepID=A0ACC2JZA0_9PEZI|nr:hypothetical protein O1611_g833 [Lasiodiplodia mahajangana]